jgi:actin-related protein 8
MFERNHANEIFNAVVNSLGFAYAFVIQDHVCASFGAGISCATVVDVGDQKISVSCVEDGTSFPQSRVCVLEL